MNGEKYVDKKLAIHMHIHKCTIFMHDGAPCHRSVKVRNLLTTAKVTTLERPGNSPDLKQMEYLQELLKTKVAGKQ